MMGRNNMHIQWPILFLGSCILGLCLSEVFAEAAPEATMDDRCRALAKEDFSAIQDAPTMITGSVAKHPSTDSPSYCQVEGYVAPNVGFLLRLPIKDWNGKFLQLGCGGSCGTTTGIAAGTGDFSACMNSLKRGYACIVSDNGHTGYGELWAYNNLQAELDHAYRGAHVTALTGKAIVERYYKGVPKKSYFWGCSKGGQQALMEAQRFPGDFDGILAGDPSLRVPELHMALLWAARAVTDSSGKLLLSDADIETLHKAVLEKCDLNDGVKDGLIGDPRLCKFDPATLTCPAGTSSHCLTVQQVEAIKKVYAGPVTSQGTLPYAPVALPGSERTWRGMFSWGKAFANDEFRYSGFSPNPGPTWTSEAFDFDRDYKRVGITKALYSPLNPDLREFKAAGGKLLGYQGWTTVVPLHWIDYYETAERTMGGRAQTEDFFRLFVVPGMDHCTGGDGAYAVDWLTYLEDWVEKGQAPQRLIGSHLSADLDATLPDGSLPAAHITFPLDPATIVFSRPIYPYPMQVKYRGHGDSNDAVNFGPGR